MEPTWIGSVVHISKHKSWHFFLWQTTKAQEFYLWSLIHRLLAQFLPMYLRIFSDCRRRDGNKFRALARQPFSMPPSTVRGKWCSTKGSCLHEKERSGRQRLATTQTLLTSSAHCRHIVVSRSESETPWVRGDKTLRECPSTSAADDWDL